MKKILVFVSGMSPAIISETIYALATQQPAWIADEIIIFTTSDGKDKIIENLINNQILENLAHDLNISLTLPLENILIPQVKGKFLSDIRDNNDNMEFANFISQKIYKLTNNDNTQLYVSMAGGRKTMGFYLAYTLTLYGRKQDKLLHVLVNSPFETIHEFNYPKPFEFTCRDGIVVNFNDAKIELAEIPFVRLRNTYSNEKIKSGKFYEAVQDIDSKLHNNNGILKLDCYNKTIECDGVKIKLGPFKMAIYSYFANYSKEHNTGCILNNIEVNELKKQINIITRGLNDKFIERLNKSGVLTSNGERFSSLVSGRKYVDGIRSDISKINSMIQTSLGIHSDKFEIISINNGSSDNLYQVKVKPENIIFI
jgi:CRISPR-associated protein (TIGR02584 family)